MIVGLGETGLSYARFLTKQGEPFVVLDDSPGTAGLDMLQDIRANTSVRPINSDDLASASNVYVSPGVPLSHPLLVAAGESGARMIGDIALFGELAEAPLVAITGTNGKSTVTQLVWEMASAQLNDVRLGGNIGTPCLDILGESANLYVLEVSSYQLELAAALPVDVAVVLNLSPDHQDRYDTLQSYYDTKLALYHSCRVAVINRQLAVGLPDLSGCQVVSFGTDEPVTNDQFGLVERDGVAVLLQGRRVLVTANELALPGTHNHLNVLAAVAIGSALGLELDAMLSVARSFRGLPHRSELVANQGGVSFVNDSKATNPGAMIAAVIGQATGANIHLIAGGDSKGLDFTEAANLLEPHVKSLQLIGRDQSTLARSFASMKPAHCSDLTEAVARAAASAVPGDIVLLAPGCASFDQFRNYAERGDRFRDAVEGLLQ